METIGSAERSTDVDMMRDTFLQLQMANTVNYFTNYLEKKELKQN